MKFRELVAMTVAVGTAGSLLFFSCGKDDGGGGDKQEESSEGKDVTQPFTLAIAGAGVDVPAGAFDAGSKLVIKAGTAPAEFTANADVSSASVAAELVATDANGGALPKAKLPLTIQLDVTQAAALAPVEKKNENLCVLSKGQDGVLRKWAFARLAIDGAKVKFPGIWMGVYQLLYCGENFADVAQVNEKGDDVAGGSGSGGESGAKACDLTKVQGLGYCLFYAGKTYHDEAVIAQLKTSCVDTQKGQMTDSCPTAGLAGVCASSDKTTSETGMYYYTADQAAVGEAGCTGDGKKWYAGAAYVPTPPADQKAATSTNTSTNSGTETDTGSNTDTGSPTGTDTGTGTEGDQCAAGTSCMVNATNQCFNGYDEAECAGVNGDFDEVPCPTSGRVGCCVNVFGGADDVASYAPMAASTAQSNCTISYTGTWVPD